MRRVTIYRVEGKEGIGMFRGKSIKDIMHNTHIIERHRNFNTPCQDNLNTRLGAQEWFCAYKNRRDLKKWVIVPTDLKYLVEVLGFKVFKIVTKEYQMGSHQVLFTKKDAISKEDVTNTFFKTKSKDGKK